MNSIKKINTKTQKYKDSERESRRNKHQILSIFATLWQKIVRAFILAFLLNSCIGHSDSNAEYQNVDSLFLIPQPVYLEKREGCFKIDFETQLYYETELKSEGNYLASLLDSASTFSIQENQQTKLNTPSIELKLVNDFPPELQNGEAYRLIIAPEKIQITALTETGIMRGIQTVRQLFIPAFHTGERRAEWYLPALKIEDVPSFEHRGLMLDVCRHFFEKDVILKYIDALAFYKMNVLHFHLTEDQGWRIQIDKYPKLNEISSYRTEKDGSIYGGFYTKKDLHEIVAYAKERHIVVIPEIELPGHAQAALAAYPQFSCNGDPIQVANDWGVFKEIYCAGNDSTYTFIEDILTEVMEIFPSEYIHIGGDEAPKFRWEHCTKCQQRMKDEDLKNEHELQSYFIQRIEKFLNSNGRKLIGWDEILEGGLSENASVQSWRGMEGGLVAAQQKHYVVMSPTSHCYLDYSLDAIDLKKVYSFNPIPPELKQEFRKFILGAEVNMWTEHVPDESNLDSKVFPRMIALAEMLWSGPDTNQYSDFYQRLQKHYPILEYFKIQFGMEGKPFSLHVEELNGKYTVSLSDLSKEISAKWRFLLDVDSTWNDYTVKGIQIDSSDVLVIEPYKSGRKYGQTVNAKFAIHKAIFKSVVYKNQWNEWYPASENLALVDGKLGSENFRDGNWQGFWGEDIEVVIDLGSPMIIHGIEMHFLEYSNAWIMKPKKMSIFHSSDNLKFSDIPIISNTSVDPKVGDGISVHQYILKLAETETRYVKIVVKNYGKMPASHEAAGQDSWLFIDEIIVE